MNMRAATPEEELRKLIVENPGLPLVPMCTEECGNPDYGHTMCEFTSCRIDEWVVNPLDEERILYRSQDFDDFRDEYEASLTDGDFDLEEVEAMWNELSWQKAIIVHIDALT